MDKELEEMIYDRTILEGISAKLDTIEDALIDIGCDSLYDGDELIMDAAYELKDTIDMVIDYVDSKANLLEAKIGLEEVSEEEMGKLLDKFAKSEKRIATFNKCENREESE